MTLKELHENKEKVYAILCKEYGYTPLEIARLSPLIQYSLFKHLSNNDDNTVSLTPEEYKAWLTRSRFQ